MVAPEAAGPQHSRSISAGALQSFPSSSKMAPTGRRSNSFHLEFRGDMLDIFELNDAIADYAMKSIAAGLTTNIVSDYISLFIIRRFLLVGASRPALVVGPLLGMGVVYLTIQCASNICGIAFETS